MLALRAVHRPYSQQDEGNKRERGDSSQTSAEEILMPANRLMHSSLPDGEPQSSHGRGG